MIVGGQSTTDDSQDDVDVPIVEQLATLRAEFNNLKAKQARSASTIATLEAEVQTLKARQSSVTVENRMFVCTKLCFTVCRAEVTSELIGVHHVSY